MRQHSRHAVRLGLGELVRVKHHPQRKPGLMHAGRNRFQPCGSGPPLEEIVHDAAADIGVFPAEGNDLLHVRLILVAR